MHSDIFNMLISSDMQNSTDGFNYLKPVNSGLIDTYLNMLCRRAFLLLKLQLKSIHNSTYTTSYRLNSQ